MSETTGKKKSQANSKSKLWIAIIEGVLFLAFSIITFAACANDPAEDTGEQSGKSEQGETAGQGEQQDQGEQVELREQIYADIVIKDYGTITISLDAEAAPETVENFISLAESGFYDGLTFHRIWEGFMMQGGDPNGDGTGGSETTITGEFSANGHVNNLSHTRGTVSMARAKDYNSASSQFFIVQEDSTYLDGEYAAFGTVVSGMEIVDQICADAEPIDRNRLIAADAQPVIESITIHD